MNINYQAWSTDELISYFFERGGKMDSCYLNDPDTITPMRPSIGFLDSHLYMASTTRDLIIIALNGAQKKQNKIKTQG